MQNQLTELIQKLSALTDTSIENVKRYLEVSYSCFNSPIFNRKTFNGKKIQLYSKEEQETIFYIQELQKEIDIQEQKRNLIESIVSEKAVNGNENEVRDDLIKKINRQYTELLLENKSNFFFGNSISRKYYIYEQKVKAYINSCLKETFKNIEKKTKKEEIAKINYKLSDRLSDLSNHKYIENLTQEIPAQWDIDSNDNTLCYINTDVLLNYVLDCDNSFNPNLKPFKGWIHIPNIEEKNILEVISKLTGDNRYENLGKYFKKRQMSVGLDCEFRTAENKKELNTLLSYQWYSFELGVGVIRLFNKDGGKYFPEFSEELYKVKNFFTNPNFLDICVQYGLAEWSHFNSFFKKDLKNFKRIKARVNSKGKKVTKEDLCFLNISNCITTGSDHIHYRRTLRGEQITDRIKIRDNYILTNKQSLAKTGQSIGFAKFELTKDEIENMDVLRKNNLTKYCKYSLIDSMVTVCAIRLQDKAVINEFHLSSTKTPPTISAIAGNYIKNELEKGIHAPKEGLYEFMGYETTKNNKHYLLPQVQRAIPAYYGGKNECYFHGILDEEYKIRDYDLKGAYPSAMMALEPADWKNPLNLKETLEKYKDLKNIPYFLQGYLTLDYFKFKDSVKFPAIPQKINNSLVFVLEGERVDIDMQTFLYCIKNDLFANYNISSFTLFPKRKSEEIRELENLLIDVKNKEPHNKEKISAIEKRLKIAPKNPIAKIIVNLLNKRQTLKEAGKSIEEQLFKLIANSIYGKFCQGISPTNKFSIIDYYKTNGIKTTAKTQPIDGLFNPVIVANITGIVRIAVSEAMERIENIPGVKVLSATTDGFTATSKKDFNIENKLIKDKDSSILYHLGNAREEYKLEKKDTITELKVLDLKHFTNNAKYYSLSTRFYFMTTPKNKDDRSKELLIAKGGIKTKTRSENQVVDELCSYWENYSTSISYKNLTSLNEIAKKGGNLKPKANIIRKSFDFDLKRKIDLTVSTNTLNRVEKPLFYTKPYKNLREYMHVIDAKRSIKNGRNRLQNLKHFEELNLQTILNFDIFKETKRFEGPIGDFQRKLAILINKYTNNDKESINNIIYGSTQGPDYRYTVLAKVIRKKGIKKYTKQAFELLLTTKTVKEILFKLAKKLNDDKIFFTIIQELVNLEEIDPNTTNSRCFILKFKETIVYEEKNQPYIELREVAEKWIITYISMIKTKYTDRKPISVI